MPRFNPLMPEVTRPSYKYVTQMVGDSNQLLMNTFYFIQREGATSVPDLLTLHGRIDLAYLPLLRSVQSVQTTYRRTTLHRLDKPEEIPTIIIQNPVGLVAGDALPGPNCFRLTRRTTRGGQRGQGMVRLGLVPESATIGDNIAAAFEPTMDALVTGLKVPITTPNPTDGFFDPALLTRTFTLGPVIVPVVRGAILMDWDWEPVIGTQRTRLMRPPN